MFGWTRRYENLLANYRAVISDQRDEIRELREQLHSAHDKIMALSSPASLREVRRAPLPQPGPVQAGGSVPATSPSATHVVQRAHWPAGLPNLRPPTPKTPPGRPTLTDNDVAAVAAKVGGDHE